MAIAFSIPGDPVPQPRARVTVRNGKPHGYVEKKHRIHSYRQAVARAARTAGAGIHGNAVELVLDFVFARPKSHMRKGAIKPDAPLWPRQDIDNLEKAVLDALNGVAWNDDSQVVRVSKSKCYGTEARTTVRIT